MYISPKTLSLCVNGSQWSALGISFILIFVPDDCNLSFIFSLSFTAASFSPNKNDTLVFTFLRHLLAKDIFRSIFEYHDIGWIKPFLKCVVNSAILISWILVGDSYEVNKFFNDKSNS